MLVVFPLFAFNGRSIVLEDFNGYSVGKFPSDWRTWPFQRGKAMKVYSVKEENGNKYLSAYDNADISVQILKNVNWKIENDPALSFKWRAKILPKDANETNPATNDSACGVYVVFSKARQEMMKFVWSTAAPVGTAYEKVAGKAFIIVKESGSTNLNKWQTVRINVPEEYHKYFKRGLDKSPVAIAILTDGNATHSTAACDYDDFKIE